MRSVLILVLSAVLLGCGDPSSPEADLQAVLDDPNLSAETKAAVWDAYLNGERLRAAAQLHRPINHRTVSFDRSGPALVPVKAGPFPLRPAWE